MISEFAPIADTRVFLRTIHVNMYRYQYNAIGQLNACQTARGSGPGTKPTILSIPAHLFKEAVCAIIDSSFVFVRSTLINEASRNPMKCAWWAILLLCVEVVLRTQTPFVLGEIAEVAPSFKRYPQ